MRTLYLLRHAKSSWANAGLDDHDRPLNARGQDACVRLAGYFRAEAIRPDLVLCSTAERTRATLHGVMPGLPAPLNVRYEPALYLAEAEAIARVLRDLPDAVQRPLVIGHNPGMEDLAAWLLATPWPHEKFPTGGFAAFELAIDSWAELKSGTGRLTLRTVPRALPG